MRIVSLKRKTIPKVAVLVMGLAAAVLVTTINPAPAQAYSSNPPLSSCAGCHSSGVITPGATVTAPATVAPGATYSVTVTPAVNPAGGMSGYSIVPVAPATGSARATGSLPSYTATMTAPIAAGAATYNVWTNQGPYGAGVAGSARYTITVAAPVVVPVSSFTNSVAGGVAPLTVAMTDTSTNTPTSWAWNFGNGTTSTLKSPSVTYAAAGTYTVTLIASNAGGAGNTATKVITVTSAVPAPTASFSALPISGIAPLAVTFADTSTGAPTSWVWTFGNGSSSNVQNPPVVTYTTAGTYTVTLIASNAGGASAAVTQTITVTPAPASAFISALSPKSGLAGFTTVSIQGSNFGADGVVLFNGLPVATSNWTDVSINFVVPAGSGRVQVTVTPTGAVASNTRMFRFAHVKVPRI